MNPAIYKTMFAFAGFAALTLGSPINAAEPGEKGEAATAGAAQSSIDKLVANQPGKPSAASSNAASDKPMVINFSDFVKDGAGCGVPNLDTSGNK